MVALAEVDEAEAKTLAEIVEISLSTMSNQMTALTEAQFITVRKGYVGRRPRTWLSVSALGRRRLATHLDALRLIAGRVDTPVTETARPADSDR
jgi:DNA-binding MarR family transcriptional regulator